MQGRITYLRPNEIDAKKWDACVTAAGNGLVYGYSFYLDAMTDNWDGLVLDDYRAVMPLPWRKKWGLSYLYHPFLTAQLGVFGNGLTEEIFLSFLRAVPKKFRRWDFSLNHGNLFSVPGFLLYRRQNFVLPLNATYEALYKAYRENVRRNVKKCRSYECTITTDVTVEDVVRLTKLQAAATPEKDFQNFVGLFGRLKEKGLAKTYGVQAKNGQLLASAAFLFSHHRAYYLLVGNHPNGRTLGASHALIDAFIKDHAGQELLLDFEGSDLRNLAFFYSSFGAREESYAAVKYDGLKSWRTLLALLPFRSNGGG